MNQMEEVVGVIKELMKGRLSFVDAKSELGRKAIIAEGTCPPTGVEDVVALNGDHLYCIIERVDDGWVGWMSEHETTATHATIEACIETVRQRHQLEGGKFWYTNSMVGMREGEQEGERPPDKSNRALSDYEKYLLKQWGKGDYSVEPYVSSLIGKCWACEKEEGFDLVVNLYDDNPYVAHVVDLDDTPQGVFKVPPKKPHSEADIVEYNPGKYGSLSSNIKKKVLYWLNSTCDGVNNWVFLKGRQYKYL